MKHLGFAISDFGLQRAGMRARPLIQNPKSRCSRSSGYPKEPLSAGITTHRLSGSNDFIDLRSGQSDGATHPNKVLDLGFEKRGCR
jgi:hypothetical protein